MPTDINTMPFEDALKVYQIMRKAFLNDDQKKLEELKVNYPALFEEETAMALRTAAKQAANIINQQNVKAGKKNSSALYPIEH